MPPTEKLIMLLMEVIELLHTSFTDECLTDRNGFNGKLFYKFESPSLFPIFSIRGLITKSHRRRAKIKFFITRAGTSVEWRRVWTMTS